MSLVQMSISGGVLTLFVLAVRALALHHLPKTTFLVLWETVALRLLLPGSIPLPFGVYTQVEHLASALENGVMEQAVLESTPIAAARSCAKFSASAVAVIWLVGAGLLAAYFTISYVRNHRKFRTSVPCEKPFAEKWLAKYRIVRPMEVRESDQIFSPLTYGIFRPVILLSKSVNGEDEAALTCILTHEYVHIRRFDAVTKLVLAAVLCVHWFNPLVWMMYVFANRDMELSCDECVVRILGEQEKSAYALTLINLEEQKSGCAFLCSHFSKNTTEERIESIMKYKRSSVLAVVLSLALVIGATAGFAASGAEADDDGVIIGRMEDIRGIEEISGLNTIIGSLEDLEGTETASGDIAGLEQEGVSINLAPDDEVMIGTKEVGGG